MRTYVKENAEKLLTHLIDFCGTYPICAGLLKADLILP